MVVKSVELMVVNMVVKLVVVMVAR